MTTKKQLMTDEEYKQVILMAVTGKPQTTKQIEAVIATAEKMRAESLMLESVLAGQLCMYDEEGVTMFCRPNARTERRRAGGVEMQTESDTRRSLQ